MTARIVTAVCSAKPRPSTQNNHSKGSQHWKRDVWHILDGADKKTLCGRDASEYLTIGQIEIDKDCCLKCRELDHRYRVIGSLRMQQNLPLPAAERSPNLQNYLNDLEGKI